MSSLSTASLEEADYTYINSTVKVSNSITVETLVGSFLVVTLVVPLVVVSARFNTQPTTIWI